MARSKTGRRGGLSKKKEDPRVVSVMKERALRSALSPREEEILHAAVAGQTRAQMCRTAKISDNTLKSEVRVLMKKLSATNLQEVVIGVLRAALGKRR